MPQSTRGLRRRKLATFCNEVRSATPRSSVRSMSREVAASTDATNQRFPEPCIRVRQADGGVLAAQAFAGPSASARVPTGPIVSPQFAVRDVDLHLPADGSSLESDEL